MHTCSSGLPVWRQFAQGLRTRAHTALGCLAAACLVAASPGAAADAVNTPYGEVTLPFALHQVPDVPVYYVIGLSGVPGADNEGHTSNAGFVVTDARAWWYSMRWAHRHSVTGCCKEYARSPTNRWRVS